MHCPALPLCPFKLQSWFVPEVGPVRGLGSGSALPSRRSRPQFQPQFQLQSQSQSLRQSLRSLRGSGDTRPGWDPGLLHQYHRGDPGGPGPPSGPVLPDQGSHHHPGPSHHQQQHQRIAHPPDYPQPRGSGGPYSSGILSRGMPDYTPETFIRSRITTSRR